MREGWEIKRLGEVIEIRNGKNQKDVISEIGKYPILGSGGNIMGFANDFICEEGTTIIGRKGNISKPIYIKDKFWNVDTAFGLYPKNDIPTKFVYYTCLNIDFGSMNRGTTIPSLVKTELLNISIPIPKTLLEQQRIVNILDEAFAAIDKAKANAEKNLKNAKELFESYLQGVFENKGDDWEEHRMKEVCTLINGRAYNKEELLDKGKYAVLRVGNFFTNRGWYFSDLELPEDKYCVDGDLLYAWSASFGPRIWKGEKVIYHYHIWKVVPNLSLVTKEFLFILFEWDKEKIKEAQGTGATMMHVSKGSMEDRLIPIPSLDEQDIIVNKLDALSAETKRLESIYQQKLTDLEELKKSILQKAFNGELNTADICV